MEWNRRKGFNYFNFRYLIFEGEYLNGKIWNGIGIEYNYDCHLKYEGEYKNGEMWNGKVFYRKVFDLKVNELYEIKDGKGKELFIYYNYPLLLIVQLFGSLKTVIIFLKKNSKPKPILKK